MLNKIILRIFGVFDVIKDFICTWGVKVLIVLFACMVLHNVFKMSEISSRYSGDYKSLVPIYEENSRMLNTYMVGEGENTIVILAGFGSQSPVIQYKTLVEDLKSEYRVVVIEYFGYGYSMSIKEPRTNENMALEIRRALEFLEIPGPYILMPHSSSNMYAMYFQKAYPELVKSIVSIDGLYPAEIKDSYHAEKQRDYASNINITSIFELTGYERVLSYLRGDIFYIDKMQAMTNIYTKEDISIYRNRIGSSYLTRTMVREINALAENMKQMQDYQYPDYLPTLSVLSADTVAEYDNAKKNLGAKVSLKELAEGVITNPTIQKVQVIEGDHMLQITNPTDLLTHIKSFLASI